MRKIFCLIALIISIQSFGQQIKVLDKETRKPIDNVTVFNEKGSFTTKTTNNGVVDLSDLDGNDVLIFSHLNYALFKSTISSLKKSNYIVLLARQSEQLDEVVLSVFKDQAKTKRIAEEIAVISAKEIQQFSPQTSADLLANIPGIKVQKSQMGGGSPVIRGMETNRVLLVVDGVRMNNAIYRKGHIQNSITVSPNQLDRTEIVFGPSSVAYGSDALGGVIHYYTKTPKLSENTTVNTQLFNRYSSANDEFTTSTSVELGFKKWASFTSFAYSTFGDLTMGKKRSHGFEDWGKVFLFSENNNDYYSALSTVNDNPDIQKNTGYHQSDFLQKLYIPLNENTDLKLNIQYSTSSDIPRFDRLQEYSGGDLKFAEWYYGPQERLMISPQINFESDNKWIQNGSITMAYQDIKESRVQRKFNSLARSYRKEQVQVYSLNGDFSVPLTENKNRNLTYGFEFSYNDVSSVAEGKLLDVSGNDILGFTGEFPVQTRYPDGGSSYFSSAAYIGYRQDLNDKSTLNTGVRFTKTKLEALWLDTQFIVLPEMDIELNNEAFTYTIGYVFKPNTNWQLNAVLSSGFRSPNIDDVGRVREKAGDITVPNIYVKPEYVYNAEIGIQKYFNDRKFRLGFNTYYTLLDNYIIRDHFTIGGNSNILYDGELGDIVANQNRDTAYITGFTASYTGRISSEFTTSGFITYTEGRTYDTNEPLSSIPPLFGQFHINYEADNIELGANLRFNSRKKITDYNFTEGIDNHDLTPIVNPNATEDINKYYGTPSWVTVGLNSSYQFNTNWKVQAMIQNLFDQHYREFASGLSSTGRNFSFSLITTF